MSTITAPEASGDGAYLFDAASVPYLGTTDPMSQCVTKEVSVSAEAATSTTTMTVTMRVVVVMAAFTCHCDRGGNPR